MSIAILIKYKDNPYFVISLIMISQLPQYQLTLIAVKARIEDIANISLFMEG